MKKIKNIITLCLVGLMFFNSVSVHAAEQKNESNKVIIIDANKVTEDTGKTLSEVLGVQQNRATQMPTATWDWSNGRYNADFSIQYKMCYTQYKFTGYSTLYIDICASRDIQTPASDVYILYLMKGSGQGTIVTSVTIDSTDWVYYRLENLDPGEKYAFAIGKANDGAVLTGTINIKNSQ